MTALRQTPHKALERGKRPFAELRKVWLPCCNSILERGAPSIRQTQPVRHGKRGHRLERVGVCMALTPLSKWQHSNKGVFSCVSTLSQQGYLAIRHTSGSGLEICRSVKVDRYDRRQSSFPTIGLLSVGSLFRPTDFSPLPKGNRNCLRVRERSTLLACGVLPLARRWESHSEFSTSEQLRSPCR